jgi:hypothetical protein
VVLPASPDGETGPMRGEPRAMSETPSFEENTVIRGPHNTGADRTRTDDLLVANQTLSQLSYGP